jgi:WASH complex subunit strumpellin
MEGAMVRLGEAGSRDLYPVSQYYSRKLVTYIRLENQRRERNVQNRFFFRNVLQVIPASMFALLEKVVELQSKLEELPTRLEKDKLKEFSQLDKRFEIARLTHKVSVLSRGILAMRTTLVGVVQIDPKKLLEEVGKFIMY